MIRKFWIVRSRSKLFWGLTFAISLFMLGYTLLNLLVLEDRVPWYPFFAPAEGERSKYLLLLLPLISLLFGLLLYLDFRRNALPRLFYRAGSSDALRQKRLAVYQTMELYAAFLLALFLSFWQLDRLNGAKQLPGFAPLVPILLLAALLVWLVYSLIRLLRIKDSQ